MKGLDSKAELGYSRAEISKSLIAQVGKPKAKAKAKAGARVSTRDAKGIQKDLRLRTMSKKTKAFFKAAKGKSMEFLKKVMKKKVMLREPEAGPSEAEPKAKKAKTSEEEAEGDKVEAGVSVAAGQRVRIVAESAGIMGVKLWGLHYQVSSVKHK